MRWWWGPCRRVRRVLAPGLMLEEVLAVGLVAAQRLEAERAGAQ